MRLVVCGLFLLVGCKPEFEHYPVIPPGGNPGTSMTGMVDSAVDSDLDGSGFIVGRVCLLTDARDFTSCATTGVVGFAVTLDGATALTLDDGSFTIAAPTSSTPVWHVTSQEIVRSRMDFSDVHLIPAISDTDYADLLLDNGITPIVDEGGIFASVVNSAPLVGATAEILPSTGPGVFYDGATASAWNQGMTGAFGTMWFPSVTATSSTVEITPPLGLPFELMVPAETNTLTFVVINT